MKTLKSFEETEAAADDLVEGLVPLAAARVIALSGDLGSGKTAFAKAVARALGVTEVVTSPTFIIERVYKIEERHGKGFTRLIHIDAYRLESERELLALGWREMIADPQNLIVLEWPERVSSLIPKDATRITLSYVDEHTRTIKYER